MRKTLILSSLFFFLALILTFPIQAVTLEPTPILTGTITPTPTLSQEVTPTLVTIEEQIEQVTPTPTTQTPGGIQFKELIFIGLVCFLILIIILQVYLGGPKEDKIDKPEKPQDSSDE